jgi:predicted transposase/invertase (TIGR01784 family)
LDELENYTPSESIAISTVKLVIESDDNAVAKAKELINLAKQQITTEISQREFLELIETIIVYKFPKKSREEIEKMFGFSELQQTKVYQEAKEKGILEGKLETVPFMLNLGASVEKISEALGVDVELVREAAKNTQINQENIGESEA